MKKDDLVNKDEGLHRSRTAINLDLGCSPYQQEAYCLITFIGYFPKNVQPAQKKRRHDSHEWQLQLQYVLGFEVQCLLLCVLCIAD